MNSPLDEVRSRARRALGIQRLHERIDLLEAQLRVLEPGGWERSRERWRNARPDGGLTWGHELSGEAFIAKAAEYDAFGPATRILEVGPGYGRLLEACLDRGVEFGEYLGVDISPNNVEHLRRHFTDPRVNFVVADAEEMTLEKGYDLLLSSLVFKHLYPSFEPVLRNCAAQLNSGALTCFDLIEGSHSLFDTDGVTYIRCYTCTDVQEMLSEPASSLSHSPT